MPIVTSIPLPRWTHYWKPTPTGEVDLSDFPRVPAPRYVDTGLNVVGVRDVADGHCCGLSGRPGERSIRTENLQTLRRLWCALTITGKKRRPRKSLYALAYAGRRDLYRVG